MMLVPELKSKAYRFDVSVDDTAAMQECQTTGNMVQLGDTALNRSAHNEMNLMTHKIHLVAGCKVVARDVLLQAPVSVIRRH